MTLKELYAMFSLIDFGKDNFTMYRIGGVVTPPAAASLPTPYHYTTDTGDQIPLNANGNIPC